jgi:hypothetical protein
MSDAGCNIRIAGLLELVELLEGENERLEGEVDMLRAKLVKAEAELAGFAAAVKHERPTVHDDDDTIGGLPRHLRERDTVRIPQETMAAVVHGRLR